MTVAENRSRWRIEPRILGRKLLERRDGIDVEALVGGVCGSVNGHVVAVEVFHRIGIINGPNLLFGIDKHGLHAVLDAGADTLRARSHVLGPAHGVGDPPINLGSAGRVNCNA